MTPKKNTTNAKTHQWHVRGSDRVFDDVETVLRLTDEPNASAAFRYAMSVCAQLLAAKEKGADVLIQQRGYRPRIWESLR